MQNITLKIGKSSESYMLKSLNYDNISSRGQLKVLQSCALEIGDITAGSTQTAFFFPIKFMGKTNILIERVSCLGRYLVTYYIILINYS